MKPNFFTEISSPIICEHKSDSWIADHSTPFHFHDGYEILIFLSGNASFCIGQHEQLLTPGTIICCAPFSLHRALPHDPRSYDRILLHIRKHLAFLKQHLYGSFDMFSRFFQANLLLL